MRHLIASELNQLSILQHQSRLTGSALYDLYDSRMAAKAEIEITYFATPSDPDCTSLATHHFGNRGAF